MTNEVAKKTDDEEGGFAALLIIPLVQKVAVMSSEAKRSRDIPSSVALRLLHLAVIGSIELICKLFHD